MGRVVGPIGIGIGVPGNGARAPITPLRVAADLGVPVLQWARPDQGVTLGSTLRASGTTPPVLTLTGSLSQATGIRVECTTGGARGTWVLRYSLDSGVSWVSNVLSAATVALGTSGITLNIAVGTANVDNVWLSTAATLADRSTAAKDYTQATVANQPLYFATGGPNGRSYVSNNIATSLMGSTLTLPPPATTPTLIYIVGRTASWVINKYIVTNETGTRRQILLTGATPQAQQGDGAGLVNANVAGVAGSWFRWAALFNNATTDFLWIGATKQTGVSAGTTPANTARYLGHPTAGNSAIFDFADVLYTAPASAAIADQLVAALDSRYLLPWYGSGLT